jgi:hypothetical protein
MIKKRRTYMARIVGGNVMMPADLKRLHRDPPSVSSRRIVRFF